MIEKNIEREKVTVEKMVGIYCKGNGHTDDREKLCNDCDALLQYAFLRIEKCPFIEDKPFCANCRVQCYKKDKKEQMKTVMRYAGPRMLLHHPILAIRHLIESRKTKKAKGL